LQKAVDAINRAHPYEEAVIYITEGWRSRSTNADEKIRIAGGINIQISGIRQATVFGDRQWARPPFQHRKAAGRGGWLWVNLGRGGDRSVS